MLIGLTGFLSAMLLVLDLDSYRRLELIATGPWLASTAQPIECRLFLLRSAGSNPDVSGRLIGIGDSLAMSTDDGFQTEVQWSRIDRIEVRALKVPGAGPSKAT